jgi:hypothetical protein
MRSFHDLYSSSNITGKIKINHELGRACGTYWKRRDTYWVFQRLKLEARDRWEDQKEMGG